MKQISGKAGLSQIYTNYYVCASTITHLYQAGGDAPQICFITKHKNESTCLITSAQHQNKREVLRELYQVHLYLLQQKQWNHSQPQRCQP